MFSSLELQPPLSQVAAKLAPYFLRMSSRDISLCACLCVCVCVCVCLPLPLTTSQLYLQTLKLPAETTKDHLASFWKCRKYYVFGQIPNRPLSKCQFLPYQFYSPLMVCLFVYISGFSQKPGPKRGLSWLQKPRRHTWLLSEWAPAGSLGTVIAASSDIPSWSANLEWKWIGTH